MADKAIAVPLLIIDEMDAFENVCNLDNQDTWLSMNWAHQLQKAPIFTLELRT